MSLIFLDGVSTAVILWCWIVEIVSSGVTLILKSSVKLLQCNTNDKWLLKNSLLELKLRDCGPSLLGGGGMYDISTSCIQVILWCY